MLLAVFVSVTISFSLAQCIPLRHHKYLPPRFLRAQSYYSYYSPFPQETNLNNYYYCVKLCFAYLLPQYSPENIYQCYSNFDCPENHLCSFSENLHQGTCVLIRRYLNDFLPSPPFVEPQYSGRFPSDFKDIVRCAEDSNCPPNTKCVTPGICAILAISVLPEAEGAGSGDFGLKRDEQDDDFIFGDAHNGYCPSKGNETFVYPISYTQHFLCVTDLDCSRDRKCCEYSAYEHKVCLEAVKEVE